MKEACMIKKIKLNWLFWAGVTVQTLVSCPPMVMLTSNFFCSIFQIDSSWIGQWKHCDEAATNSQSATKLIIAVYSMLNPSKGKILFVTI